MSVKQEKNGLSEIDEMMADQNSMEASHKRANELSSLISADGCSSTRLCQFVACLLAFTIYNKFDNF